MPETVQLIPSFNAICVSIPANTTLRRFIIRDGAYSTWRTYQPIFAFNQTLEDELYIGGEYINPVQRFVHGIMTTGGTQIQDLPNQQIWEIQTGNEALNIWLYPCRPDTEYEILFNNFGFNLNLSPIGTVRTLSNSTAYHEEFDVTEDISFNDKLENAELIREFLDSKGWSEEAIAGVLGFMYCTSGLNPANIRYSHEMAQQYHYTFFDQRTASTDFRNGNTFIHYNSEYVPSELTPYWLPYIESYFDISGQSGGNNYPIPISGFGLMSIISYDQNFLYSDTQTGDFPSLQFWTGESQINFLDIESRNNWYWDYAYSIDQFDLELQYRTMTYTDFRTAKLIPETMAHIFLAHKASITSGASTRASYLTTLTCAKQWARYFYKPKHKRHKMPLWEYLRYTV